MESVLAQAETSVRLPHSALQVLRLTQDTDTPVDELTEVIEVDPALAARVLRVANSASYAKSGGVSDIRRAVNWMGFREISQIAIAVGALGEMSKLQNKLMAMTDFHHHSLMCAALCDEIARSINYGTEGAFTAGLLHDIGLLILFNTCEHKMMEVMEHAMFSDDVSLVAAENALLGYDHTQIGAALAQSWGMPQAIVESIRHHHDLEWHPDFERETAIVAYANIIDKFASDPADNPAEPCGKLMDKICAVIDVDKLDSAKMLERAHKVLEKMMPRAETAT